MLGLLAAVALALAGLAQALAARRDLGEGLLPERPGPARAAARLSTPLALAWRLQRALLAGWALGFVALGAAVGAVASGVGDIFDSTPQLRELLPGGEREIVDAYLALTMGSLGLMAAVEGVQAAMRLRGEEAAGRAEPVLATAVGRVSWALGHVALAAAGPAALLATGGLVAGLVHGARTGDVAGEAPRVLAAALVQLPAAWVLAGLAVGLWGIAPRLAPASWAALVAALLLGQLGPLLGLDQRVLDLSPFAHVPALPGADVTAAPLAALTALAAGLTAIGLAGLRRRDVG